MVKNMGQFKNYLLRVQEACSEEMFGQDAVEWEIISGWVTLTGDLDTDTKAVMGEGGVNYDAIITAYRSYQANMEVQNQMEEILTGLILQPIRTTHNNGKQNHRTADVLEASAQRRPLTQSVAQVRRLDDHCKV
jgi:hypothetical protein